MDYQMRLLDRSGGGGGGCVSREEYVDWRMSGDAFPFSDGEGNNEEMRKCLNPTLISGVITKERRSGKRATEDGFW